MPNLRLSAFVFLFIGALACISSVSAEDTVLAIDENNDSLISRAEWKGDEALFNSQDLNHDGFISNSEARWTNLNNDNVVTSNEMNAGAHKELHSESGERHDKRGIRERWKDIAPSTEITGSQAIAEDLNNDSVISRNEWRGDDKTFYAQDTNHDGVISNNEARWNDLNHDNVVSANEMDWGSRPAAAQANVPSNVVAQDLNNDSVISRNEWFGDNRSFYTQDTNHDGVISNDEARWNDANHDNIVTTDELSRGYDRPYSYSSGAGNQAIAEDLNNDSMISRNEWRGDNRSFYLQDTNHDGVITNDEARWTDSNHNNIVERSEMNWGARPAAQNTVASTGASTPATDNSAPKTQLQQLLESLLSKNS